MTLLPNVESPLFYSQIKKVFAQNSNMKNTSVIDSSLFVDFDNECIPRINPITKSNEDTKHFIQNILYSSGSV